MNSDQHEIDKFDQQAHRWWDLDGPFKPLHQLNPVRLKFITDQIALDGKTVLDVGCGGGILTEAMAKSGANTTGLDMAAQVTQVAEQHAALSSLDIKYHCGELSEYANQHAGQFDVVTCMEMLEHVPDPAAIIANCAQVLKPGGMAFFSTLNRRPMAFLKGIIGAEYILNLVPRGTHEYAKFIKPAELAAWARDSKLEISQLKGMDYNPISKRFSLTEDVSVNYLVSAQSSKARQYLP